MKEAFKIVHRARTTAGALSSTAAFSLAEAEKALAFHSSFPEYSQTPLAQLDDLAGHLGVCQR